MTWLRAQVAQRRHAKIPARYLDEGGRSHTPPTLSRNGNPNTESSPMTTLIKIENAVYSNGDVGIRLRQGASLETKLLAPGDKLEQWVTTSLELAVNEFGPSRAPPVSEEQKAGGRADQLIAAEVAVQDRMWGVSNERADATKGQMIGAAVAQASAIWADTTIPSEPGGREGAFEVAKANYYPADWDGFRDYGSNVANLVVAAAYLRSEIKRRIAAGEDTTRTKRGEPYTKATPYMSSDKAGEK